MPPGLVAVRRHERMSRAEIERQVVEQLVYQHAEYRDRAAHWARLILDVKNMAVEGDVPSSIADHVRNVLAAMAADEPSEPSVPIALAQEEESDAHHVA